MDKKFSGKIFSAKRMDDEAVNGEHIQMIKYLQKRIQDQIKEKNVIVEMNEDLERELEKKEKLLKDVSTYHSKSQVEHKEELFTLHKKKEISEKLIKTLQNNNGELKTKLENALFNTTEVERLFEEVNTLKDSTKEKENNLAVIK